MRIQHRRSRRPRTRRRLVGLLVLIVGLAGAGVAATVLLRPGGPLGSAAGPPAAAPASTAAGAPVPVEIEIPAISVRSSLVDLAVDRSGELQAPADPAVAGWYAAGVVPGEVGPAVIGGHVDSKAGPGIFYALRKLRPGDLAIVRRSDGSAVTFRVIDTTNVPKSGFPTQLVYGPTPGPELRLVTCGGRFDRAAGSYLNNVIVEAVIA